MVSFSVGTKDGTLVPGFGRPDGEGDDRLAHILNEASHLMKNPGGVNNDDSRSNEDSSSPRTQCLSPYSKVRRLFCKYYFEEAIGVILIRGAQAIAPGIW